MAYKILHHPIFHVFDLVLSVLLMLLALIEKPAVFGTKDDERPIVTVSYITVPYVQFKFAELAYHVH